MSSSLYQAVKHAAERAAERGDRAAHDLYESVIHYTERHPVPAALRVIDEVPKPLPTAPVTNAHRVRLGRYAVETATVGDIRDEGAEESATDAVANVLHWAHSEGVNVDAVIRQALVHFKAETTGIESKHNPDPHGEVDEWLTRQSRKAARQKLAENGYTR